MSPILITSNAEKVAAELRAFSITKALIAWSDTTNMTIVDALRSASPVGKRDDPRTAGNPHMRDRIKGNRLSSIGRVVTEFTTNVGLYPYYVSEGVSGGVTITPKDPNGKLAWMEDGGQWRYARSVIQGAITANPFPQRAWDTVEAIVLDEMIAQLRAELRV